ncbi:MAG: hypothetical protein LBB75_05975 [Oscillospiraceae bacterium]|jgi:hypothetical protein|nr:hypothetical protein [Oscillospiraceae bacterium]
MYVPNEYTRAMLEEERRLLREMAAGRFGWRKIGQAIKLNALLRSRIRPY